jgi:hypothetical protein
VPGGEDSARLCRAIGGKEHMWLPAFCPGLFANRLKEGKHLAGRCGKMNRLAQARALRWK